MKFTVSGFKEYDTYYRKWRIAYGCVPVHAPISGPVRIEPETPPQDGEIRVRATEWQRWLSSTDDPDATLAAQINDTQTALDAGRFTINERGYVVLLPNDATTAPNFCEEDAG